ncbi:helix-turn-helix transcriptional regulator [Microbacterium sp.]|uniref:helix-turn-helix transcriptional regulator n=1 Tax=Microbacterium sp. TaxID=51671 RepID=UPI003A8E8B2E
MSNVTALKPRVAAAGQVTWLSPAQVCDVIPGMTVTLLSRMRDAGKGPRYAKPSPKTVVYSLDDVHAYVRSTLVTTREQS